MRRLVLLFYLGDNPTTETERKYNTMNKPIPNMKNDTDNTAGSDCPAASCFACCERFAKEAGRLQSPVGGGLLYPYEMRRGSQFDRDDDGTWNIAGCCGGCYVVTEMKFCPFCGADLLKQNGELNHE